MSRYSARATVYASNYQNAIRQVGEQMDALWGNGNWSLENCHATPFQDMDQKIFTWEWDFDIVWLGMGKGKSA